MTTTRGLVLGKFLPPHAGHVYLCEFARRWVTDLTIVVGTLAAEPIAAERRVAWMRELFPFDRVVHLDDENPQDPSEHPDFWSIWKTSLERVLAAPVDVVFASDAYGAKLAEVLGARFVAVDPARAVVPVSGTAIRDAPLAHWHYLPRCVRPHFLKRVSVLGPESTGKTTLARSLADAFRTTWAPEWARTLLESRGGELGGLEWMQIVRGQIASEESRARDATREDDRPFAQRDGRNIGVMRDRLGDDVDRVGIVEQSRVWANRFHISDYTLHDVNRAQRHEEAARPLRFLADHAMLERDRFIDVARCEAARSEAGQHRVAIGQPSASVGGGADGEIDTLGARQFLGQLLDDSQALWLKVDQHNLGALKVLPLMNERRHRAGRARAAATNVGQLDPGHR